MLVRESLSRFDLLNDEFLAENILNEKFDINLLTNNAQKIAVLASMFLMFAGGRAPQVANKIDKDTVAKQPMIYRMAEEDFLSRDEIFTGFTDLLTQFQDEKVADEPAKPEILSAGEAGFIEAINLIKPGRLDTAKIDHYDQYDNEILAAVKQLEAKGEDPNADLIKSIMLIETGMTPVKNNLGYEGFPQTKERIINGWTDKKGKFHPGINQKHGTNFTMKDMYHPGKAAEFIHYYLKSTSKSSYVNDLKDLIIAYNWGVGNLGKYKKGEKELPQQTADYIKMVDTMQDFWGKAGLPATS